MTTAAHTAHFAPTTEPAAQLTVGGQGHDLLDGGVWSLVGGFVGVLSAPALVSAPGAVPLVGVGVAAAAGLYGAAKLFLRKRVDVGRRGEASVVRTALGVGMGGYDHDVGTFDFVSVHDVRNDRLFGTGLKQMIRDLFRPQFELALKGESTEEYLGMYWSAASCRQAADELALKTGLTVYDRTTG